MNLKVMMSDLTTTVTISGVSTIKENGSFTNFYEDGDSEPIASFRTLQVAYWQKV